MLQRSSVPSVGELCLAAVRLLVRWSAGLPPRAPEARVSARFMRGLSRERSRQSWHIAQVAELADARASGARGGNPVEVRFLSWALLEFKGLTTIVVSPFLLE